MIIRACQEGMLDMSRVGKKPILVPEKTKISYENRVITVQGAKGTLTRSIHPAVDVKIENGELNVVVLEDKRTSRALQGLTRTLINNMVVGVNEGYHRVLEINGVGYRADVKSDTLHLSLGYSHPIQFKLPKGIQASVDRQNRITLTGIDKELLGLTAAKIRDFRKCEPYKGKGIRYSDEEVRRKVGKAGVK